jgi:anti-sigma regulatory factor (Ser/Thr protein kinase)
VLTSRPNIRNGTRSRVFRAVPEALAAVRVFLRERCADAGLPGSATDDVILAASEASSNAVLHSGGPSFRVTWTRRGDRIEIRVRDRGRFHRAVATDSDRHGGNGIPVMTALMDEISVRRGTARRPGTDVLLVKDLSRS